MIFGKLTGESVSFTRLETATTTEKVLCYVGFEGCAELKNLQVKDPEKAKDEFLVTATVNSHALEKGDNIMLEKGDNLVRDVEARTCYMKGEKMWIQLY